MVAVTKKKVPREGMQLVATKNGVLVEIPLSSNVGSNCVLSSEFGTRALGENCTVGDNSKILRPLNDRWTIGSGVYMSYGTSWCNRPAHDVSVGDGSIVPGSVQIHSDVTIGHNVVIGEDVELRNGVKIPDNWKVPDGYIVNPGPDGYPVAMSPPAPTFRCGLAALNKVGYTY